MLRFCTCTVSLSILFVIGCGPTRVPVSGSVKYKDQPVANANVTFVGAEGNYCSAMTDASGAFASVTSEMPGDGAVPGVYKVAVIPVSQVPDPNSKDPYAISDKPSFPQKYLSTETSKIEVTISENMQPLTITLEE